MFKKLRQGRLARSGAMLVDVHQLVPLQVVDQSLPHQPLQGLDQVRSERDRPEIGWIRSAVLLVDGGHKGQFQDPWDVT